MSTKPTEVLPNQQALMLSGFFTTKELVAASLTCKAWHAHAKKPLEKLAVNQLVEYIVLGNEAKAKEMLEANPKLLLKKGIATDYSGRIIKGTAFQAALGAEDERMWAMMKPYFEFLQKDEQIESAQEEMLKQFNRQFPDGIQPSETDTKAIHAYYQKLAGSIADAADGAAKNAIITDLRANLNTNRQTVTHGKHFNMQHLLAAYKAYVDNFDRLANWNNRDMFWQQVIGYVQIQMPANYAQAHCSGLETVLDKPSEFKRTFKFYYGGSFFPVSANSGLGFDFACYSYHTGASAAPRHYGVHVALPIVAHLLNNCVKQKQYSLISLGETLSHTSQSRLKATV